MTRFAHRQPVLMNGADRRGDFAGPAFVYPGRIARGVNFLPACRRAEEPSLGAACLAWAMLGRFLSPDPHVTDPGNTQSYNRYSSR